MQADKIPENRLPIWYYVCGSSSHISFNIIIINIPKES